MGNKKNIIIALLMVLSIGFNVAVADNSNTLTQIDIKKASAADTVDVTLYTTDSNINTVVTKKSGNRYVVLLPSVTSNSSVTPSIGGLKDVISNVEVKHIDDGIGGYTKVTFETTKPISIKTYNKKSTQLTQAQRDSQAIIAKNNTKPAVSQTPKKQISAEKPVVNTANTSKPAETTQPKTNTSKIATNPVKQVSIPKLVPIEIPKISLVKKTDTTAKLPTQPKTQATVKPKTVEQPKVQPKIVEQPKAKPIVKSETNEFLNSNYKPQMKFDENGKRMIDLEPRVSHSTGTESMVNDTVSSNENTVQTQPQSQPKSIANEDNNIDNNTRKGFPWWVLLAGGTVVGGGLLYLIFDAIRHSNEKDASRLESFFSLSTQNQAKRRRREYYDIVNDNSLNWQEKYKRYIEKEKLNTPKDQDIDASYVTNVGASKSALIMPTLEEDKQKSSDELAQTIKRPEKSHNEIIKEKLQAKISQMEHSLAQTPRLKEPEEVSNEVKSEENAIINKISDIKLKSFAKPRTLNQTQRNISDEDIKPSIEQHYKEGKYVKLSDSLLSVSRRSSASTQINTQNTGNKYLTNNGEMNMNKENENYQLSSLGEYMAILDAEEERKSKMSLTETLSQIRSGGQVTNGATNPISKSEDRPIRAINSGLVVKSGYNIDSDKGIYLVNIDGVSAIIGRIKGNTYMLKKFDRIIDKQLQVRPENDHVYIVRTGSYKCLVDVTSDKMGTLIEI